MNWHSHPNTESNREIGLADDYYRIGNFRARRLLKVSYRSIKIPAVESEKKKKKSVPKHREILKVTSNELKHKAQLM